MNQSPMGPIILDIAGLSLSEEDKEILKHPLVGGMIFFSRNYESREQIAELAKEIKSIRSQCILCVDQEGGRVQRFKNEMTLLPRLRILGDLIDKQIYPLEKILEISEKLGQLMALEVRSLGIDLSFAPVLDLDKNLSEVIQDRAFHHSPEMVAQLAIAYIKGMSKAGMKATGKHFPGHGSVKLDSHLTLPEDLRSFEQVKEDLYPFKILIENKISAIMPAHIVYPNIDPLPVGFSSYWLQTILRQQLNFKGVIISDDLSMEGATCIGNYTQRAQKALQAGCDFVLVCNNRNGAIEILESVIESPNDLINKRRQTMLAEGETPSFRKLNQTAFWQAAYNTIGELTGLGV